MQKKLIVSRVNAFHRKLSNVVKRPTFKSKYDHFINGKFVPPAQGNYFENRSPIDGKIFTMSAAGTKGDVEKALDAAHAAFPAWCK